MLHVYERPRGFVQHSTAETISLEKLWRDANYDTNWYSLQTRWNLMLADLSGYTRETGKEKKVDFF